MALCLYIIIILFNYALQCFVFVFVRCPCTAINVVSVQHNAGFLPGIILHPMLRSSENPFRCHEEVLHSQPMIPPKRFDIFSPDWGMLRRSRCVQIFF